MATLRGWESGRTPLPWGVGRKGIFDLKTVSVGGGGECSGLGWGLRIDEAMQNILSSSVGSTLPDDDQRPLCTSQRTRQIVYPRHRTTDLGLVVDGSDADERFRSTLDVVGRQIDKAHAGSPPEGGSVGVPDALGQLFQARGANCELGVGCQDGDGVELLEGALGGAGRCLGGSGEKQHGEGRVHGGIPNLSNGGGGVVSRE